MARIFSKHLKKHNLSPARNARLRVPMGMPSHGRSFALLLVLFFGVVPPLVLGESAGSLYKKGKDAEARQKYESAYEFFKQAYDQKPKDLRYRTAYTRTKFYAAAVKVHRGQILRDGGRLEEALAEFQAAAAIDPSIDIAQQEIRITQRLIDEAKQPQPEAQAPAPKGSLYERLQSAQGPVELAPISDQPITLKLTEDSKMIYETLGKLAGINVLFDPEYTSRRVRIELNGVSLQDALQIVAFESKTFWRPITSNTIFVAADTVQKRKEIEQNVIKTFYLSNISQPTDLQDMVNVMRSVLQIDRIQQLPSQNAIVLRGTPDQVALAEKLIGDIDKAKPEVVIEVAVMQVRRDKERKLGVNLPTQVTTSFNNNLFQNAGQTSTGGTGTSGTGTSGTTTSSGSGLTFNTFKHLTSLSYSVAIPPASAEFLFTDSDSKVIQSPQIRAVDGAKGTLRIGDRIPIATGSFANPFGAAAGVGGQISSVVQTQFQYQDVGVLVDITPKIHANREVTLKVSIEVSSVTGTSSIGGISQPIIGTRKIEHEVRLRDGEINLMGGIFEEQDVVGWSGIPGLGKIPLFRYLFAHQDKTKAENEIVFVMIPHIVRGQELTPLNQRALDIGNGNTIELRRSGKTQAAVQTIAAPMPATTQPAAGNLSATVNISPQTTTPSTSQAVPAMPAETGGRPQPEAVPGSNPPANPPGPQTGGSASLRFDPPAISQSVGQTASVNVVLDSAAQVQSLAMQLQYDPNLMQLVNVINGGYLSRDGQPATLVHRDEGNGKVQISGMRPPGSPGISGQGAVFTLVFLLKAPGTAAIAPLSLLARDASGQAIAASGGQAVVQIQNPHP